MFCNYTKSLDNKTTNKNFVNESYLFTQIRYIVKTFTTTAREPSIYKQSPIFWLLTKKLSFSNLCKYGNFSSFLDSLLPFQKQSFPIQHNWLIIFLSCQSKYKIKLNVLFQVRHELLQPGRKQTLNKQELVIKINPVTFRPFSP